jgi:hypothetical protein
MPIRTWIEPPGPSVSGHGASPALERASEHHGERREDERRSEQQLRRVLDGLAVGGGVQDQDAGEGSRDGPDTQPPHQLPSDGPPSDVHPATDRLHDHRCNQIGRDGRRWVDVEEDQQDRRHECPAAHTGQAHREPDQHGGEHDRPVDVHESRTSRRIRPEPEQLTQDRPSLREGAHCVVHGVFACASTGTCNHSSPWTEGDLRSRRPGNTLPEGAPWSASRVGPR